MSFDKLLPHLLAVVIFLLMTCFFFKDIVFNDMAFKDNDISMGSGMGKQIMDAREEGGDSPMWNLSAFGGMPAYVTGAVHKDHQLKAGVQSTFFFFLPNPANLMFAAMLFTYIMLIAFKTNPYVAIFGAIAFGMASYNILSLSAGHNAKIRALCFIPLLFAGIQHLKNDRRNIGIIILLFGFSWLIFTGHYQIMYYGVLIMGIYFIVDLIYAIVKKELRKYGIRVAIITICGFAGLLANIGKIWTITEYSKYSIRGEYLLTSKSEDRPKNGLDPEYAFQYQEGVKESLTLLIPNFNGGGSSANMDDYLEESHLLKYIRSAGLRQGAQIAQIILAQTYFGPQGGTAWPIYAGAITSFLFVLGFFVLSIQQRIWIGVSFLFFLFISWGMNAEWFAKTMFNYFPMYNKFRAVSMSLGMVTFTMALGAALTLGKILSVPLSKTLVQKTLGTSTALIVMCFYFVISPDSTGNMSPASDKPTIAARVFRTTPQEIEKQNPNLLDDLVISLKKDRVELVTKDSLRTILFIALALVVLALFYFKIITDPKIIGGAFALLCLIDLWSVNKRYISPYSFEENREVVIRPTQADRDILADASLSSNQHYRVLNTSGPYNESNTSYYHRSLGGYSPAKLRRTQDIYDYYIEPVFQGTTDKTLQKGFSNYLKIADCKFLLIENRSKRIPQSGNLGPAWFVSEIVTANSHDDEIQKISEIDPRQQAIVHKEFQLKETKFDNSQAKVDLKQYTNNEIVYKTSNPEVGYLVFSEIYYPAGWSLYIDGKLSKLDRTNYNFRGARIPTGDHEVVLKFEPTSYIVGSSISLYATIFVIIAILYFAYIELKSSKII